MFAFAFIVEAIRDQIISNEHVQRQRWKIRTIYASLLALRRCVHFVLIRIHLVSIRSLPKLSPTFESFFMNCCSRRFPLCRRPNIHILRESCLTHSLRRMHTHIHNLIVLFFMQNKQKSEPAKKTATHVSGSSERLCMRQCEIYNDSSYSITHTSCAHTFIEFSQACDSRNICFRRCCRATHPLSEYNMRMICMEHCSRSSQNCERFHT